MKSKKGVALTIVLLGAVLPHLVISLTGFRAYVTRPIVMSLLFTGFSITLSWWGLDPQSRMLTRVGAFEAFDEPRYRATRPRIRLIPRAIFLGVGIFSFVYLALLFVIDSIRIARGEKPTPVVGTLVKNSSDAFGAWYFNQSLVLSSGPNEYELWYSLKPLRVGETYQLYVLQNSNLALDFR